MSYCEMTSTILTSCQTYSVPCWQSGLPCCHRSANQISALESTAWGGYRGGGGGLVQGLGISGVPLAAPIGLSPLLILTLCGSEHVLVVSTIPWMTCPV